MAARRGRLAAEAPRSRARLTAARHDAGGTSWRPATAPHDMLMRHVGDWMLMAHGNIDRVDTSQNGPRGDDRGFVAGMVMGAAQRRFEDAGALRFGAALSPDPLMGKQGYALLLAAGETADGIDTLVDRQHRHDIFIKRRRAAPAPSAQARAWSSMQACRASQPSVRRPSCMAPPPSRTRKRQSPAPGATRRTSHKAC